MTDIEEEQPTQERGRRDWKEKSSGEATMTGPDELGGTEPLVPSPDTVAEEHKGQGDGNPGGTLEREGDPRKRPSK